MSDFFGDSPTTDAFATAQPYTPIASPKGAPWWLLGIGVLTISVTITAKMLLSPNGNSAWALHLAFWLLILVAFLVPVAFFSIVDLKRQANLDYPTSPKSVKTAKTAFLAVGLLTSIYMVYDLASELARILNVG